MSSEPDTNKEIGSDHPPWINAHSVTCLICGGLADERCTRIVREEFIGHAIETGKTQEVELLREIMDTIEQGEVHPSCFKYALKHGLEEAENNLEPATSRT